MTRRPLVGVVAVLLLLGLASSSCAAGGDGIHGRDQTSTAPRAAAAVAAEAGEVDGPVATEASAVAAGVVDPGAAAAREAGRSDPAPVVAPTVADPGPAAAASARASDGLAVVASAHPVCATHGGTIEVRITTAPGATLGLAAAFADHQPHGAMGFGEAGADGGYVWRVVVPADAPVGEATAVVGADLVGEGGDRRSGHAAVPFRVSGIGGCA